MEEPVENNESNIEDQNIDTDSAYKEAERDADDPAIDAETTNSTNKNYNGETIIAIDGVEVLNFQSDPDKLTILEILMELNLQRRRGFNWRRINEELINTDLESKLTQLIEERILFISSEDFSTSVSLAYQMSNHKSLKVKERKEVFFNHSKSKKTFSLVELVNQSAKHFNGDLFIVATLERYLTNDFEKVFFETLINQQNTDCLEQLRQKNIFLAILVSKKLAFEIIGMDDDRGRNVWIFDAADFKRFTTPDPEAFFDDLNPIQKVLVYTATFFDKLSFRSFKQIANYLLAGAVINEQVIVEQYKDFNDGAQKVKQILTNNKTEIWEMYLDNFLKDCYLEGHEEGGMYIVDFLDDGLREKLKKYFKEKQHFFWQNQFDILDKHALLFNPSINNIIADNLIDLITEAMADDPAYYDDQWFLDKIYDISNYEGQPLVVEGSNEDERSYDFFWKFVQRHNLARFFYSRLIRFFAKMYQRSLNDKAEYFLNALILAQYHEVLLKVTEKLLDEEKFNKFYWVKQLIDRSTGQVKTEAYRLLINKLSVKEPEKAWDQIKTWLPGNKEFKKYSPSNHYASFFIVHYHINEITNLPVESYGTSPSVYPLFKQYPDDFDKFAGHFNFVLRQFFHKGTRNQFLNSNASLLQMMSLELFALHWSKEKVFRDYLGIDEPGNNSFFEQGYIPVYSTIIADIVETWFHIVKGFEIEYSPKAEELNQFILSTLFKELSNNMLELNAIKSHWERKPAIYNKQFEKVKKFLQQKQRQLKKNEVELFENFAFSLARRNENIESLFIQFNQLN